MIGLNNTATVLRATFVQDEYGAPVPTWTTLGRIPCRLEAIAFGQQAQLQALGAAQHTIASHRVYLPYDPFVTVERGDRLAIEGVVYNVLSVEDVDRTGHHLECHVARLEGAV